MKREILVAFADAKIKKTFDDLENGDSTSMRLHKFISRAIDDLKQNPFCGIHIPKRLIPRQSLRRFTVDNLWKYNLPDAWRLIYTVKGDQITIISVILEWMNHKDYERKFKYG